MVTKLISFVLSGHCRRDTALHHLLRSVGEVPLGEGRDDRAAGMLLRGPRLRHSDGN